MKSFVHIASNTPPNMRSVENDGLILFFSWKFLLYIFILEVLSLIAYSPSVDQTNSSAVPKDLFLHANAVYIMYSPSPHTTTNLPFGLCLKLCG
uniref:Uncharacterized protein n=1 Tax=Arundo donax TaxID=35708 RepID=A0A0A9CXH0_ARUDO